MLRTYMHIFTVISLGRTNNLSHMLFNVTNGIMARLTGTPTDANVKDLALGRPFGVKWKSTSSE